MLKYSRPQKSSTPPHRSARQLFGNLFLALARFKQLPSQLFGVSQPSVSKYLRGDSGEVDADDEWERGFDQAKSDHDRDSGVYQDTDRVRATAKASGTTTFSRPLNCSAKHFRQCLTACRT